MQPVGFKTLQEVTGYISLSDGNILRITSNVLKVQKTDKVAPDGMPVYNFQHNISCTVLTKEEYKVMNQDMA